MQRCLKKCLLSRGQLTPCRFIKMAPVVGVFPLCPFPSVSICSQAQCFPGAALPLPANWPLDAGSTDFSSQNQPSHLYSTLPFFFLKKMLAAPSGMWDPSSPTRDQTHVPCIGRQSLNRQESPSMFPHTPLLDFSLVRNGAITKIIL